MDFRNTKIRIKSQEHSKDFQEAVFAAGGRWLTGSAEVKRTFADFMYVDGFLKITFTDDGDFDYFNNHRNKEITFPEPQQGHPHAEMMAQYAEVAKTNPKPWEEFEYFHAGEWVQLNKQPVFSTIDKYRRKSKVKIIHGVEVPDISFVPKDGESYFYPTLNNSELYRWDHCCDGCETTKLLGERGLCYPNTVEGKQAATLHAKAMLGIK